MTRRRWAVIGAGAAGCVVAARLAEAGEQVVVIEAGGGSVHEASRHASMFDATARPELLYPGLFLRGRGVGGSSAVNGMIATRGNEAQYRSWGWDDSAEAFARIRVPMRPATDDELGPVDRALLTAAPDAICPPLTRLAGRRVTAFDAYLAERRDVDLQAECTAVAAVFDHARAVGVELADGRVIEADAVVVSAGAVGSPPLLVASGVGGPDVGRHLRNHAAIPVDLRLRRGTAGGPHGLAMATLLRRGDLQVVAVNHLGPDEPDRARLLVMAMASTAEGRLVATDEPAVQFEPSDVDRARLAAGLELALGLLDHDAFRDLVDDVEVGSAPAGVYHATSTCRMGDVVDDAGAVIDITGLYVIDASIFPELPQTNTYLPTLMLAERMVGRILARASHDP